MVFTRCYRVKWNIDYVSLLEGMVLFVTGDRHVGFEKIPAYILQELVSLLIAWGTSCYETYKRCDFKSWAKQAWKVEKPTKPWQNERGQGIQQRDMTRSTR